MSAAVGRHRRERRRVSAGLGAALALIGSAILPGAANATTYYDVIVGNQIYTIGVADPKISYANDAATITATDWWIGDALDPNTSYDPATARAISAAAIDQYSAVFDGNATYFAWGRYPNGDNPLRAVQSIENGTDAVSLSEATSYSYVIQSGSATYVPEIDGAALAQGALATAGIGLWCAGRRRETNHVVVKATCPRG